MGSELSQDHKSDLSYRDRPLAVQMVADAASDGRYAIFIEHPSRSVLERYLGYKDLWGLGFFGHGGLSYYDDSDPHIHWALGERLARLARRGRHGLSYMVFNMCDGGGWGDALGEGNENRRSKETIGPRYMGWDEGDYERHTDNWEREIGRASCRERV